MLHTKTRTYSSEGGKILKNRNFRGVDLPGQGADLPGRHIYQVFATILCCWVSFSWSASESPKISNPRSKSVRARNFLCWRCLYARFLMACSCIKTLSSWCISGSYTLFRTLLGKSLQVWKTMCRLQYWNFPDLSGIWNSLCVPLF